MRPRPHRSAAAVFLALVAMTTAPLAHEGHRLLHPRASEGAPLGAYGCEVWSSHGGQATPPPRLHSGEPLRAPLGLGTPLAVLAASHAAPRPSARHALDRPATPARRLAGRYGTAAPRGPPRS